MKRDEKFDSMRPQLGSQAGSDDESDEEVETFFINTDWHPLGECI